MGGAKVTRVRVLRTCAVGESSVDRLIGDLMTESNPTVGLAVHIGQTDVRIAAKADTEDEADRLIAPVEEELRKRLGVAIYGVGKETVVESVAGLLRARGLKIGIVDTITDGRIARDFEESGFSDVVESHTETDLDTVRSNPTTDGEELAKTLANGNAALNLVLVGPMEDRSTYVAVRGADGIDLSRKSRNYQDSDHIRRWLATQALDWVRRGLLGQLTSPAD